MNRPENELSARLSSTGGEGPCSTSIAPAPTLARRTPSPQTTTEVTGVLHGFRHDTDTINDNNFGDGSWALGNTQTAITILPNQRIIADVGDEMTMHMTRSMSVGLGSIATTTSSSTAPHAESDIIDHCTRK